MSKSDTNISIIHFYSKKIRVMGDVLRLLTQIILEDILPITVSHK